MTILRGGAYKPRTSPYAFQGMGEDGLKLLEEARELTGMKIVTEVMAPDKVEIVAKYADILQIGARNMQNFDLLKECAEIRKPVLLKRGLSATIEEWLQSAEYILSTGKNRDVILCETRHPHLRDLDPEHDGPERDPRAPREDATFR